MRSDFSFHFLFSFQTLERVGGHTRSEGAVQQPDAGKIWMHSDFYINSQPDKSPTRFTRQTTDNRSYILLSLKPRPFVRSFFVLRYVCAPTGISSYLTTVCVLFFVFLGGCRFFRSFLYHYRFLFLQEEYFVRYPLLDGVFLP